MSADNQEEAAIRDIIARPEVTGGEKRPPESEVKKPLNISMAESQLEPDELEKSAGKVMAKTIEDLKAEFGMTPDADFARLMSETLGGMFSALRMMSGAPWMRFAVAGGAILFAFTPPFIRYLAVKKEEEGAKK